MFEIKIHFLQKSTADDCSVRQIKRLPKHVAAQGAPSETEARLSD